MTLKQELHHLIETLPEDQMEQARKLLGDLSERNSASLGRTADDKQVRPIEEIAAELAAEVPKEE